MKKIINSIFTQVICIIILFSFVGIGIITLHQQQLSDCQFECNHLQIKTDRLETLGEYETALYQLMLPLGWAQLRAANEICKQKRQFEFEGCEMPLMEIGG